MRPPFQSEEKQVQKGQILCLRAPSWEKVTRGHKSQPVQLSPPSKGSFLWLRVVGEALWVGGAGGRHGVWALASPCPLPE